MRIGIGLSMAANAPRYDAEDLVAGTLSLDFVDVNDQTMTLNFVAQDYRVWVDDLSWPYGLIGIFKVKT